MTIQSNTSTQIGHTLRQWLEPSSGPMYEMDLTEFYTGTNGVKIRRGRNWGGDFFGRPELAMEVFALFSERPPIKALKHTTLSGLRSLFRFLDEIDADRLIVSSQQFDDYHGLILQQWLGKPNEYGRLRAIIFELRQRGGHSELCWPARPRDNINQHDEIDLLGMRRLYLAIKKECMAVKAMFREGKLLAEQGQDPRGQKGMYGSASWQSRVNHAWLVHHLTKDRLLNIAEIKSLGGGGLSSANNPKLRKHSGAQYIAPRMSDRCSEGIAGKLRWFHPSYHETALFLWLFVIGTGWNLSTALALDLSEEWHEPHPQKTGYRIIHAFKRRSSKYQFAISLEKPEWHPYRIIRYMQERTHVLRRTVEHRLREQRISAGNSPTSRQTAEIERLSMMLKSPWLYHVVNKIGDVNQIDIGGSGFINEIGKAVVRRHRLDERHPTLRSIKISDARDAWLGHTYSWSGHNVIITRFAAQHEDASTLKHYLWSRRYRSHSEKKIRLVQNAIFSEIATKQRLDPTRLRILVEEGTISSEQEQRLLDHRKRTRLGMGCLDPTNPPRSVAPAHPSGTLCRVQRCTGCSHGMVFADSLQPIARARAELIFLKRSLPLSTWVASSLEDEERSLEATLTLFDAAEVQTAIHYWLAELSSGRILPHDTYPLH